MFFTTSPNLTYKFGSLVKIMEPLENLSVNLDKNKPLFNAWGFYIPRICFEKIQVLLGFTRKSHELGYGFTTRIANFQKAQ